MKKGKKYLLTSALATVFILAGGQVILPVMSGHLVKHVEMLQTPWG